MGHHIDILELMTKRIFDLTIRVDTKRRGLKRKHTANKQLNNNIIFTQSSFCVSCG